MFWLTCASFTLFLISEKDSLHHQLPCGVTLVLQLWTIVCFPCSQSGQHKKQTHKVKLNNKNKHCIYMEDCTFLCSFLKQHTCSQSIFEEGIKAATFEFLMVKRVIWAHGGYSVNCCNEDRSQHHLCVSMTNQAHISICFIAKEDICIAVDSIIRLSKVLFGLFGPPITGRALEGGNQEATTWWSHTGN